MMDDNQRDELLTRLDERQSTIYIMVKSYHKTMVAHLLDHKQFKHNLIWKFLVPLMVVLIASAVIGIFSIV